MIWTVANHKGGVGKTTTALTLAHLLHDQGEQVALVDLDAPGEHRQAGAAASYRRAQQIGIPAYLLDDMPDELPGYVVIDCPPDASSDQLQNAIQSAELVIVPTSMSYDDLEVSLAFVDEHLTFYPHALLLTRVLGQSRRAADELIDGLRADGYTVLSHYTTALDIYAQAGARGGTVASIDTYAGRKASNQYRDILGEVRMWTETVMI